MRRYRGFGTATVSFLGKASAVVGAVGIGLLIGRNSERTARTAERLEATTGQVADLEGIVRQLVTERTGRPVDAPIVVSLPPDPATGRGERIVVIPPTQSSAAPTTTTTTRPPSPSATVATTSTTAQSGTTTTTTAPPPTTTTTAPLVDGCVNGLPCVTVGVVPPVSTTVPSTPDRRLPVATSRLVPRRTAPEWRTPVTWNVQREETP